MLKLVPWILGKHNFHNFHNSCSDWGNFAQSQPAWAQIGRKPHGVHPFLHIGHAKYNVWTHRTWHIGSGTTRIGFADNWKTTSVKCEAGTMDNSMGIMGNGIDTPSSELYNPHNIIL